MANKEEIVEKNASDANDIKDEEIESLENQDPSYMDILPNEMLLKLLLAAKSVFRWKDMNALLLSFPRFHNVSERFLKMTFEQWATHISIIGPKTSSLHKDPYSIIMEVRYEGDLQATYQFGPCPANNDWSFIGKESEEEYVGKEEKVYVCRNFPRKNVLVYTNSVMDSIMMRIKYFTRFTECLKTLTMTNVSFLEDSAIKWINEFKAMDLRVEHLFLKGCYFIIRMNCLNELILAIKANNIFAVKCSDVYPPDKDHMFGDDTQVATSFGNYISNVKTFTWMMNYELLNDLGHEILVDVLPLPEYIPGFNVDDDFLINSKATVFNIKYKVNIATLNGISRLIRAWIEGEKKIDLYSFLLYTWQSDRDIGSEVFEQWKTSLLNEFRSVVTTLPSDRKLYLKFCPTDQSEKTLYLDIKEYGYRCRVVLRTV